MMGENGTFTVTNSGERGVRIGVSPLTWGLGLGLGPFHARLPSSCSPSSTSLNSSSPSSFTPSRALVTRTHLVLHRSFGSEHRVSASFPSPSRRRLSPQVLQAGHSAEGSHIQPLFKAQTAAKVCSVLPLLKIKQAHQKPPATASSFPTSVREKALLQAEMPI
jgi:hypothetical protein